MKAAVFTGGGADGAVTVGRLSITQPDYDLALGISTGSLIGPLALIKQYDRLKEAYESADTSDITEVSAFTKKGTLHIGKALFRSLLSLVSSSNTIGKSNGLRNMINDMYTYSDFETMRAKGKSCNVGCYSLTSEELVFFNSIHESFDDFKEWMWASANVPVVMSILKKKRYDFEEEWVDGGTASVCPLVHAISMGAKEVDVYMHSPRSGSIRKKVIKNTFHLLLRTLKSSFKESSAKDIDLGLAMAKVMGCVVRIHWMDREYYDNSLVFGKDKMKLLFKAGQELAKDKRYTDIYDYSKSN